MPRMDWEAFQRDHHRPHLMIVSIEPKGKASPSMVRAGFERLAMKLRASGNYAFKREGTIIYASFEDDADAARFAAVLQPKQTTRESDWASKALVHMDDAACLRIRAMIKGRRLRRKLTQR
jgi:hypothetical protein